MAGAISSTGKTDYTTPDNLLVPVRVFFARLRAQGHYARVGGAGFDAPESYIDVDPCSNAQSLVKARINIRLEPVTAEEAKLGCISMDGFEFAMPQDANQYINPPFGRGIERWFGKAYRDFRDYNVATVLCVPDTPDTGAWGNLVLLQAEGRCQIRHRPRFGGMKTGIPKTVSYLYYGPPQFYEDFLLVFQHMGRVESPRRVYEGQKDIQVWTPSKAAPSPDFLESLMPPPMITVKETA